MRVMRSRGASDCEPRRTSHLDGHLQEHEHVRSAPPALQHIAEHPVEHADMREAPACDESQSFSLHEPPPQGKRMLVLQGEGGGQRGVVRGI